MYQIAGLIKAKRSQLDMSQRAFAEYLGVHRNTVGFWEIQKLIPSPEMYPMLSKLLDVPIEQIEKECQQQKIHQRKRYEYVKKNHQTC